MPKLNFKSPELFNVILTPVYAYGVADRPSFVDAETFLFQSQFSISSFRPNLMQILRPGFYLKVFKQLFHDWFGRFCLQLLYLIIRDAQESAEEKYEAAHIGPDQESDDSCYGTIDQVRD